MKVLLTIGVLFSMAIATPSYAYTFGAAHCLSGWDNKHEWLEKEIISKLSDKKSYEHKETKVVPPHEPIYYMLDQNLPLTVIAMQYVANNEKGELKEWVAVAGINALDCKHGLLAAGEELKPNSGTPFRKR